MNPLALGGIIESIGKVADDLFTSDKERLDAQNDAQRLGLEEVRIDAGLMAGQNATNQEEAKHPSIFVAGWRPGVGWTGVAAMAYQFVLYPLLCWLWIIAQAMQWIPKDLPPPPVMPTDALLVILSGILGIGTLRTVDKVKSVATKGTVR